MIRKSQTWVTGRKKDEKEGVKLGAEKCEF